jgi:two-component system LytT family response regulator
LHALTAEPLEPLLRLFVRDRRGRVIRIPLSDITRLVGADDYVEVHNGKASYLVKITLSEFERRLDPKQFCRVHRSAIVNLDKIVTCRRVDRRLQIELSDGSCLIASRAGSQHLRDLLV